MWEKETTISASRSGGPTTELRRWALRIAPTVEIEEVFHRRATLVQATDRWWQRTQDHDTAHSYDVHRTYAQA